MRIRKNAKISPLLLSDSYLSSDTLLQTHLCQLNQSPWDVIIFSPTDSSTPSPYQIDGDDSFTGNGSLGDSIGALESVASMKIYCEGEEKDVNGEERENQVGYFSKGKEPNFCCQTDGEGWECGNEAKEGHSLCELHLTQLKNYKTSALPVDKKSDKPAKNRPARRAKKSKSESNPYQIYYYSGFGPGWAKKRGAEKSAEPKLVEVVEPLVEDSTTSSSLYSSQIGTKEFEYIEDEEEDDDENDGSGKKRARKPIKARSLKSLM